ncbi:hypothetical protein GCM10010398_31120 [Streptomyces fimbriatus]
MYESDADDTSEPLPGTTNFKIIPGRSANVTTPSWLYCWDKAGNLTSRDGSKNTCPGGTTYTYDDASELTGKNGSTTGWSYDKLGNETAAADNTPRTGETWTDYSQLAGITAGGKTYDLVHAGTPPDALRGRVGPCRLDVVVANLVGNALRHGARPVHLRLYEDGERIAVIEVLDSGPGIPDSVLPHVFERFYKSDAARTRTEGSGLGPAITAENVRMHGGTVRAANRPEGGAVFTVELPLRRDESTRGSGQ